MKLVAIIVFVGAYDGVNSVNFEELSFNNAINLLLDFVLRRRPKISTTSLVSELLVRTSAGCAVSYPYDDSLCTPSNYLS